MFQLVVNTIIFFSEKLEIANRKSDFERFVVIPETVGQYTGLTDKNGKKIFEGDVVKVHIETYTRQSNRIGVVKYYNGCFGVADNNSENFKDFLAFNNMSCYVRSVEVIGNIHDNPELLERSE